MIVPGSNLLLQALNLIASQPVKYFRYVSRIANGAGLYETQLAAPVVVRLGSVQAMPKSMQSFLGLDMDKDYVTWYVPQNVIDLGRDVAGDEIEWYKDQYVLQTSTPWEGQDGWNAVICVKLGKADA